jgi:hypothetical protein
MKNYQMIYQQMVQRSQSLPEQLATDALADKANRYQ